MELIRTGCPPTVGPVRSIAQHSLANLAGQPLHSHRWPHRQTATQAAIRHLRLLRAIQPLTQHSLQRSPGLPPKSSSQPSSVVSSEQSRRRKPMTMPHRQPCRSYNGVLASIASRRRSLLLTSTSLQHQKLLPQSVRPMSCRLRSAWPNAMLVRASHMRRKSLSALRQLRSASSSNFKEIWSAI
jgi:hypothetical protein